MLTVSENLKANSYNVTAATTQQTNQPNRKLHEMMNDYTDQCDISSYFLIKFCKEKKQNNFFIHPWHTQT